MRRTRACGPTGGRLARQWSRRTDGGQVGPARRGLAASTGARVRPEARGRLGRVTERVSSSEPTSPAAPPTPEALRACRAVLEAVAEDRAVLAALGQEERAALMSAAGRVAHPTAQALRREVKALRRERRRRAEAADRAALEATGIRAARQAPVFVPPPRLALPAPGEPALEPVGGAAPAPGSPVGGFAGPPGPSNGDAEPAQGSSGAEPVPGRTPPGPGFVRPRACYVCKRPYREAHAFYDSMCPPCAALNYEKRFQTADLRGRVALVTGGRVKIGYQIALKCLRAGARVVVTTRFPHDGAQRFAAEPDFEEFAPRLDLYGLDLRHAPSVEAFAAHACATWPRLDLLVNNAAQTVRRPPGFYRHLLEPELRPWAELPARWRGVVERWHDLRGALGAGDGAGPARLGQAPSGDLAHDAGRGPEYGHALATLGAARRAQGLLEPARLAQLRTATDGEDGFAVFPEGEVDHDLQQVDRRRHNSWRMTLGEVPTWEMLEVQLVNAVAPFTLCARLKPLLVRAGTRDAHVVNVSAMEGSFSRGTKTDKHPHTNMAKAALNMLTLTSAPDYAKDGVFMNAVDTGWVTDEDPAQHAERKRDVLGFQPPLDIVDGAARVLDPPFVGLNTGRHAWGQFWKDYAPTTW